MRVAIFDFDGTLYKDETFKRLIDHLKEHPIYKRNYRSFFRTLLPRYIGAKLNIYPERKMRFESMQAYVAALDRLTKEEINEYFSEIAETMRPHFNETVVKRLKNHEQDDVHTMLVSGAFTPLLKQFKDEFNFDHIIGTNIPFLKDEVNKTEYVDHIQGDRKVTKVYEALNDKIIDWQNSYAYADSFSDLPVLQLVGNPIAVNPDEKLQQVAQQKNWEII